MVMRDQAHELRNLVRRAYTLAAPAVGPAPRLIALMGGTSGVGTTTLAVNLAAAMAQQGRRVVLIDANLQSPKAASLCGVKSGVGVIDILRAQRTIHEVLQAGPAGMQIVAGSREADHPSLGGNAAHQRLIEQLKSLGRHVDFVLIDAGSGSADLAARLSSAADQVVMITTADPASIMDAYARIKVLAENAEPLPAPSLIVNRAADEESARDVQQRLGQSCRRFLSVSLGELGYVPLDADLARAAGAAVPACIQSPTSPSAKSIDRIATTLVATARSTPTRAVGKTTA